ncbi:hypothetical protein JCM8547_007520 [Rhodosporidiobolus lusitaniae]
MAAPAPARVLRAALSATTRPAFSSPFLARPSPLLASAIPSLARQPLLLVPSLLPSRHGRGFASSAQAAGWLGWGKEKAAEAKDKAVEAKEPVEDKAASSSSSPESVVAAPAPEPPIVSTAPADLATSTAVSPASVDAAGAAATPVAEGHFYDGIFSGSLDITSLAGAWGPHPIMRLQSLFLHLHESFPLLGHGLTWAVLIPTVTIMLRLLLFPFQARANANAARMAIIQPEMLKGMNKLKEAKARGDQMAMQAAQIETQQLMRKHNVNPIKNLAFPLAQAAVFTCMFFALRGLANAGLPSMMNEGFGWVQDLTARDPYWVLPITSTSLTLATLETGVDSSTQVQTTTTKNMKTIFRGLLVVSLPFIAYFPAALLLYWTTNNFLSLVQTQILKLSAVRSLLNIPTPPPKPQPGDANYVPEPSFTEAFKNMQSGALEKWEETAQNAAKQKALNEKFERKGKVEAEVYTPRKQVAGGRRAVSQAAQELLDQVDARSRVIEAQPAGEQEQERMRRVAEARRRRLNRK